MSRLSLVIADTDKSFVDSMVNYLMSSHGQRFQISSFTTREFLQAYLSENTRKTDILLISPELYSDDIPKEKFTAVILLTAGRLVIDTKDCDVLNKYQHGDKLVSNMINIFSEKNKNEVHVKSGGKDTKIIAVYSPVGGSGKTSIALSASTQCAQRGLNVFYLNLEDVPSTAAFLNCSSEQNLSNIFLYLKEQNRNLALKIEGSRCIEPDFNIHYFAPPENSIEIKEILPEEIEKLIHQLRMMSQYDLIFVDMSSSFDDKNLAILNECDEIIFVLSHDEISYIKANTFKKDMDILTQRNHFGFYEKMTIVLNKYNCNLACPIDNIDIGGRTVLVRIPFDGVLQGLHMLSNTAGSFGSGVFELSSRL